MGLKRHSSQKNRYSHSSMYKQKHVNIVTFIRSMKTHEHEFKSQIAQTYDQVQKLDAKYKMIQRKTIPILKKLDDPAFELSQRKKTKEQHARPPESENYVKMDRKKLYNYERELKLYQQRQNHSELEDTLWSIPFSAERYTPFSTNAEKQYRHRSYPSAWKPSKRRANSMLTTTVPRVATIRTAPK
ncbi:hypothetical protein TRFO_20388 [Tritrichomonas foetus]|uniref:Uncharacterized protein n=1 Tax=Tritrichomonas foetus TaxID=1144522 RepID=A0A1J4KKX5_9EUKA|nr:hypothetical protein TRFO_20388 [Tritrichomonas foetus]|eukprot:OHT10350.1 hypothetical protein TRFO_20388 [Tritrichomonas foetus]